MTISRNSQVWPSGDFGGGRRHGAAGFQKSRGVDRHAALDQYRSADETDRAPTAGYDTFVVTADVPVPPNRENNIRNGFRVPLAITPRVAWDTVTHPHWLFGTWARTLLNHGMPHFENMDAARGPPVLSNNLMRNIGRRDRLAWKHVELIRKRWKGKLVVTA
jgi:isopentenyl diphosphate isomerase/L-lactate dehydrogenase-like FMN-dependent dehydrogenase